MEATFEWDRATNRLRQLPAPPLATQEENARNALLLRDIQGDDHAAREVAQYVMAELAYEQREMYAPVETVPGGAMPVWMFNPTNDAYQSVRDGIRALQGVAGNSQGYDRLMERDEDAPRAAAFLEYCHRVATCEAHNEGCLRPLLMAIAVFEERNPSGDAARAKLLRLLVNRWYRVEQPETEPSARRSQATHHTKNPRWLSWGWRALWAQP